MHSGLAALAALATISHNSAVLSRVRTPLTPTRAGILLRHLRRSVAARGVICTAIPAVDATSSSGHHHLRRDLHGVRCGRCVRLRCHVAERVRAKGGDAAQPLSEAGGRRGDRRERAHQDRRPLRVCSGGSERHHRATDRQPRHDRSLPVGVPLDELEGCHREQRGRRATIRVVSRHRPNLFDVSRCDVGLRLLHVRGRMHVRQQLHRVRHLDGQLRQLALISDIVPGATDLARFAATASRCFRRFWRLELERRLEWRLHERHRRCGWRWRRSPPSRRCRPRLLPLAEEEEGLVRIDHAGSGGREADEDTSGELLLKRWLAVALPQCELECSGAHVEGAGAASLV